MKWILALTVVFNGIIAHVDLPSNETITVIPKAPQHEPFLCVAGTDIFTPKPSANFIKPPDPNRNRCPEWEVDLNKVTVSLEGIDENGVTRTTDYTKYTIPLESVSGCNILKDEVKRKEHDSGGQIAAYILYPGGKLSVDEFFAKQGKIPLSLDPTRREPRCYACMIKLTMKTKTDRVTVRLTPKGGQDVTFDVKAAAMMFAVNGPTSTPAAGHSVHHYKIFKNCANTPVVKRVNDQPCNFEKCAQSEPEFVKSFLNAQTLHAHFVMFDKIVALKNYGRGRGKSPRSAPDNDVECTNSNFP